MDKAKNSFLQMISHEIRTPLNGIVGAAHVLKDVIGDHVEMGEFVNMLKISVDRLESFSTTALIITQLQTDNYKVIRTPVRLDKIVENSIADQMEFALENKVTFKKNIVDPSLELDVSEDLICRAIGSIIHNSIKYSQKNDTVVIKSYQIKSKVFIDILDKGTGFSKDALNKLFKPFGLGQEHFDENIGLNLQAAKMIMDVHNGDIKITNLPDSGAVVQLIFNNSGKK